MDSICAADPDTVSVLADCCCAAAAMLRMASDTRTLCAVICSVAAVFSSTTAEMDSIDSIMPRLAAAISCADVAIAEDIADSGIDRGHDLACMATSNEGC